MSFTIKICILPYTFVLLMTISSELLTRNCLTMTKNKIGCRKSLGIATFLCHMFWGIGERGKNRDKKNCKMGGTRHPRGLCGVLVFRKINICHLSLCRNIWEELTFGVTLVVKIQKIKSKLLWKLCSIDYRPLKFSTNLCKTRYMYVKIVLIRSFTFRRLCGKG